MKTPNEWIESTGIPLQKEGAIRFVAMVQEDAVQCYSVDAAIEEVEEAMAALYKALYSLHQDAVPATMLLLGDKVDALSELKRGK